MSFAYARTPLLSSALITWVASVVFVGGCDPGNDDADDDGGLGGESGEEQHVDGRALYAEPIADGNSFSCATCHALSEPAADGLRRAGHPIGDATRRPSWKNGALPEMQAAVNSCLSEWMNADPWPAQDPRWALLYGYLDQQTQLESAPALVHEIVAPPAELSGGDAERGRSVFNSTCSSCHATDGRGSNLGPGVYGRALDAAYVARRVRTSGRADSQIYPGLTGGVMPFWSASRLSDDELRDIIAYLEILDESGGEDEGGDTSSVGGTLEECSKTNARIGWTAELQNFFHDVSGTAEIVDDCHVVISNFSYDGTGIDVRIYGAREGSDFDDGFAMTDDLLRSGGYEGVTLVARLPPGESMEQLDAVSVWCVDVGIDFGSGDFRP